LLQQNPLSPAKVSSFSSILHYANVLGCLLCGLSFRNNSWSSCYTAHI
jgi:hypothetical protein